MSVPTCFRCGKAADEFAYLRAMGRIEGTSAAIEARRDGTYNPETNHFCCDACFIALGLPSSPRGWKAP